MRHVERVLVWTAVALILLVVGAQIALWEHREREHTQEVAVVLSGAPLRSLAIVSVDTLGPDLYAVTIRDQVVGRESRPVYLSLGEPVALVEWEKRKERE